MVPMHGLPRQVGGQVRAVRLRGDGAGTRHGHRKPPRRFLANTCFLSATWGKIAHMGNNLTNETREVLVCTACGEVICPHCYIDEDGDMVSSNMCQGHIENLTEGCDHGDDGDDAPEEARGNKFSAIKEGSQWVENGSRRLITLSEVDEHHVAGSTAEEVNLRLSIRQLLADWEPLLR